MQVKLAPELQRFVDEQVRSGRYPSRGEVMRAALFTLRAQEQLRRIRLEELRKEVEVGLDDIREGRVGDLDIESIKADGRRILSGTEGQED